MCELEHKEGWAWKSWCFQTVVLEKILDSPLDSKEIKWESEEELKSLLMKVKESEKAGLKLNIQKNKIMASGPIISWQIEGGKVKTVTDFLGLHCGQWLQPWK